MDYRIWLMLLVAQALIWFGGFMSGIGLGIEIGKKQAVEQR